MDCLYQYPFPGNVRELHNAIERAVTFCNGEVIERSHLPERVQNNLTAAVAAADRSKDGNAEHESSPELKSLNEVQQDYVRYVLRETGGNKRKAAEILGVTRRTLYRWLAEEA